MGVIELKASNCVASTVVGIIIVASCLTSVFFGAQTGAASEKSGGITISPTFQEVSILPNQLSSPQEFTLSNNDDAAVSFTLSTVDMGALDDTGGVVFSGLTSDYEQKYGLARWLHLKQTSITLGGHDSAVIPFDIVTDDNFGPGGHYGAVVAKQVEETTASNNQIQLKPQIATLLLVRKIGGEKYALTFQNKAVPTNLWRLPSALDFNFRNDGNIHVVPRGIMVVTDMFGHEVARGVINSESSILLPEHYRGFTTTLSKSKKILWPGRYRVEISYRYDGTTEYSKASYSFLFINLPVVIVLSSIVAIIIIISWKLNSRFGYGVRKWAKRLSGRLRR